MHGKIVHVDWRDDEAALKRLYKAEKDALAKPRLHLLWLIRSGQQVKDAAVVVGCHLRTAQTWLSWYRAGGVDLVRTKKGGNAKGSDSFLSSEQQAVVVAHANQEGFQSAVVVRDYIEQTFGVAYTIGGVYPLLKRLGIKKKVPRPINVKADEVTQDAYKKGA